MEPENYPEVQKLMGKLQELEAELERVESYSGKEGLAIEIWDHTSTYNHHVTMVKSFDPNSMLDGEITRMKTEIEAIKHKIEEL